jgi:hypothetical protein
MSRTQTYVFGSRLSYVRVLYFFLFPCPASDSLDFRGVIIQNRSAGILALEKRYGKANIV